KEQLLAKISRLAILHSMKTEDHAQDARAAIKKRCGAYLPHWTRDRAPEYWRGKPDWGTDFITDTHSFPWMPVDISNSSFPF
ncbi:MAG: hypothetical protein DMF76_04595, partial [Acidobacteria bacterium]